MNRRYSFDQTRKTWAAAGGLVATVIAYVLADNTIRDLLPPNAVAVLGAIATVLAVFKAPNAAAAPTVATAAADVQRGIEAVQTVRDHAAATAQTVQDLESVLGTAMAMGTAFPGPLTQQIINGR